MYGFIGNEHHIAEPRSVGEYDTLDNALNSAKETRLRVHPFACVYCVDDSMDYKNNFTVIGNKDNYQSRTLLYQEFGGFLIENM